MRIRGAPVLDPEGRPVGRRDPVELGPQMFLDTRPPAPVERRRATPEELARLAATDTRRAPDVRPSDGMAVMRPASRPAPPAIPADATTGRAPAGRTGVQAPSGTLAEPTRSPVPANTQEEPVTSPALPPALPCDDCLHARVCALRALIPDLDHRVHVEALGDGLVLSYRAASIGCDHHMPARPVPVPDLVPPIREEHGGESWRTKPTAAELAAASRRRGTERMLEVRKAKAAGPGRGANNRRLAVDREERERLLLEAVRATSTTAEAGERLGVTGTRVQQLLRELRDEGRLPQDIADALVARRSGRRIVPEAVPA